MSKILLVEDNEMNRDMLSRRLARQGYRGGAVADGRGRRRKAATTRPDLILMDMSLPVLDGWEATRRLKADPATGRSRSSRSPPTPWSSDREKAMAAGCDDYDTKPIDLPRLLEKIRKLLPAGDAIAGDADGRFGRYPPSSAAPVWWRYGRIWLRRCGRSPDTRRSFSSSEIVSG